MRFRRAAAFALLFMAASLSANALADLGAFSRACPLRSIGQQTKQYIAFRFNQTINGVPIDQLDAYTELHAFAFESVTTDYFGGARYWLWAKSARYTIYPLGGYSITIYPESPWIPGSATLNNRDWWMSTRSGSGIDPYISDIWELADPSLSYEEVGGHAYYNSPLSTMAMLPNTFATDCNCTQAGFDFSSTFLGIPGFWSMAANLLLGATFCLI